MHPLVTTLRSVARLVVVLTCLVGASLGLAAGQHAAAHAAANSLAAVGHHHGPSGHAHAPATDDGATTAPRRRRRTVTVRVADLTLPSWAAVTARLRPVVRALVTRWVEAAGVVHDPLRLGICRT